MPSFTSGELTYNPPRPYYTKNKNDREIIVEFLTGKKNSNYYFQENPGFLNSTEEANYQKSLW